MTIDLPTFDEFIASYPNAEVHYESDLTYVFVPQLTFLSGAQNMRLDALLCPMNHNGYLTRLFLDKPVAGKGANWTAHQILARTWHSWSWQHVQSNQPLLNILGNHLRALR